MNYIYGVIILLFVACGAPSKQSTPTSTDTKTEKATTTLPKESPLEDASKETAPILPIGAVFGDFNGDGTPFFAHVSNINKAREITYLGFQNRRYPILAIQKTVGGTVSPLKLAGNDRDLLLFTANISDPNFNKYYLYVLRNNNWKPVMNGFAIHKSNKTETLDVIRINPKKPNELLRYYSVFDIDPDSPEGYVWRLLEESVEKENW